MTVADSQQPIELFVPGRLCLTGEHSDWAGGYRKHNHALRPGATIVVGTEQGLYARAWGLQQPLLVLRSTKDDGTVLSHTLPLDPEQLAQVAARGGFWSYAAGVAYLFAVEFGVGSQGGSPGPFLGLELDNYKTTLPLKKGLSSSAAFCVLVARTFNQVFGLRLTTRGEMAYAYQGERLTPSQCGRMDQACAFGCTPVLLRYDGDLLSVAPAELGAPLHLVLVDLRAAKDTVAILAALQAAFPHPSGPEQEAVAELLGPINERITAAALEAMAAGDCAALGALMCEAQREFDARAAPLCPAQLASPVLHRVLAHPPIQPLIHGGKGVGSQGDGTAQLLCRDAASQATVCEILERDLAVHCIAFTVPSTAPKRGGAGTAAAAVAAPELARALEGLYMMRHPRDSALDLQVSSRGEEGKGSVAANGAAANGATAGRS